MRIGLFERFEAVVEIVVPKRRGGIIERIHCRDDRVNRGRVGGDCLSRQIAKGRALKNVAVVE